VVVLAPTDFVAFSQAIGTDYAASDEEKARIAPIVAQWKAEVASQQREDRGPNALGGVLAGAGILGAGLGGAWLARQLKKQGVRPEIAEQTAAAVAAKGSPPPASGGAPPASVVASPATRGLDRVTRQGGGISRARGEYDPASLIQNPKLGPQIMQADTPEKRSALVQDLAAAGDSRAERVQRLLEVGEQDWPTETAGVGRESGQPFEVTYQSAAGALAGIGGRQRYGSTTYGETEADAMAAGFNAPTLGQTRRTGAGMYQPGYYEPEEQYGANIELSNGKLLMRSNGKGGQTPVRFGEQNAALNFYKAEKRPIAKSDLVAAEDPERDEKVRGYIDREDATTAGMIESLPATSKQWPRTGYVDTSAARIPITPPERVLNVDALGLAGELPIDQMSMYDIYEHQANPSLANPSLTQGQKYLVLKPEWQSRIDALADNLEPGRPYPYKFNQPEEPWSYQANKGYTIGSEAVPGGKGARRQVFRRETYTEYDPNLVREIPIYDKEGNITRMERVVGGFGPTRETVADRDIELPTLERVPIDASAYRGKTSLETAGAEGEPVDYSINRWQDRIVPRDDDFTSSLLDYAAKAHRHVQALRAQAQVLEFSDPRGAKQLLREAGVAEQAVITVQRKIEDLRYQTAEQEGRIKSVNASFAQGPYILKEFGESGMRAGARLRVAAKDHLSRTGKPLTQRQEMDLATDLAVQHNTDLFTVLRASRLGTVTQPERLDAGGGRLTDPQERQRGGDVVGLRQFKESGAIVGTAKPIGGKEPDFLERVYEVLELQPRLGRSAERNAALEGKARELADSFQNQIPELGKLLKLGGVSEQEKVSLVFEAISMAAKDYHKAIKVFPELGAKAYAGGPGTHFFEAFMKTYVRKAANLMGIELSGGQGTQASLMTLAAGTSERLINKARREGVSPRVVLDEVIAGAESPAEAFERLDARISNVQKTEAADDPNTNGSLLAEKLWQLPSSEIGDTAAGQLKQRLAARSSGTGGRLGPSRFPVAIKLATTLPDESMFPGRRSSQEVDAVRRQGITGTYRSSQDDSVIAEGTFKRNKQETLLDRARDPEARRFGSNAELNSEFKALETEKQLLLKKDKESPRLKEIGDLQQGLIDEQREIDEHRFVIEQAIGRFNTESMSSGRVVGPGHVIINSGVGVRIEPDLRAAPRSMEAQPQRGEISDSAETAEDALDMRDVAADRDVARDYLADALSRGVDVDVEVLGEGAERDADALSAPRRPEVTLTDAEVRDIQARGGQGIAPRQREGEPMRIDERQVAHVLDLVRRAKPTLIRARKSSVPEIAPQERERAEFGRKVDFFINNPQSKQIGYKDLESGAFRPMAPLSDAAIRASMAAEGSRRARREELIQQVLSDVALRRRMGVRG